MKITKAISVAKAFYTASFALTAMGLVVSLISNTISKYFYAAALLSLLGYVVVSVAYLHCPKCGGQVHVKPLVKQTCCAHCEYRFDQED